MDYTIDISSLKAKIYNYQVLNGEGYIVFKKTKNDTLEISHCECEEESFDSGKELTIQVAKNGVMIIDKEDVVVATDFYDIKSQLEKMLKKFKTVEVPFKQNEWPDLDLAQLLIEVNAEYKQHNGAKNEHTRN